MVHALLPLPAFTPPGGHPRPVRAFVPPGPPRRRPLLLLFDGQNVFGDEGSHAGGWYAHEAVLGLGERTFERPIVVGIDNGGMRRMDELGTHADRFLAGIAEDLVPRLRARFDVSSLVIGGASLGGLAALQAWLTLPMFDSALVMSPSLWYGRRALLRNVEHVPLRRTGRLYVDAGARERGRMFADAELLCARLAGRGLGEDRLLWRPDRRGAHHERHWRRRLPKALRFLFRR
jgi:predicted alpha/beta superfamily hydrolase